MTDQVLLDRLRALREHLRTQGITHLALFGSRARGDARPDSDIDLLIEVAAGRKFSLLDLVDIERQLSETTGLPVSIVMRRSLDPSFRDAIAKEVVEVF